jgi:hypothetical protein
MGGEMATSKNHQFFERAVGFMEAYRKIYEQGFFSHFNANLESVYPGHLHLSLTVLGFVPFKARNAQKGIQPYVNVDQVLGVIKEQLNAGKSVVGYCHSEVKTTDWKEGARQVKMGINTRLTLVLQIIEQKKRRRRAKRR